MRIRHWCRRCKGTVCVTAVLLCLLLIVGVLAPVIIKYHLNHNVLKDMGTYTGHVDNVDVGWLSGSYQLKDLAVWRKGGNRDVPFFRVEDLSIGISWDAILHGAILASVVIDDGELNFLDAKREEKRQSGKGGNWLDVVEELLPTTLHRVEIHRSRITFQNFDTEPKVDIRAREIEAEVTNLTNVKDREGRRVATANLRAKVLGEANAKAEAEFDPFDFNDFVFAAEVQEIDLTKVNNFTTNYFNVDFADGHGSIFAELTARDGKLSGYVKPLLEEVDIASWEQDVEQQGDNPFQLLWEGALGFLKTLFTNAETKQFATQIDIEGSLDNAKIDTWQAVWGVVRNAFVEALDAQFDEWTPLTKGESEKDEDKKKSKEDDDKKEKASKD